MGLARVILIGEDKFKELSPVVGQFDYEYMTPHIISAQDLGLSDLIGDRLLEELYNDTLDCCISGDNEKLLERYIHPYLVHQALYLGYNSLVFKIDNSGVVKRNSDNGTSAELNESSFLADLEKTTAEAYGRKLRAYLEANADLYPEFKKEFLGETSPKNTPSFTGGLYLGNGAVRKLDNEDRPAPPRVLPVADFYAKRTTVVLGESVDLVNNSSDNSNTYQWAFGDGNFSARKNPSHIYSAVGSYSISLQVSNSTGTDVKTRYNYIQVINP